MKRQFAILFFGCTACETAFGAIPDFWWLKPTICAVNDTYCYGTTTAGIDDEWDETGNCRGHKLICGNALIDAVNEPTPMGRVAISHRNGISPDFDTDIYVASDGCYGARKTSQNGAMVMVDGEYVRVWCDGVPIDSASIDENLTNEIANGTIITTGAEPLCSDLAPDNYVATLNGNCYGKLYDPAKYSIDCDGNTPVIIVLNGAEYNPNTNNFITNFMANQRFSAMQTSAATQRSIHFPK